MTVGANEAITWRKIALQALVGAVVGGGGAIAVLSLLEPGEAPGWAPSQLILGGIGLIYGIMGLFVGIGTLAPRLIGQRLLNVADAEDIEDDRANMAGSAICSLAIGAALVLLAYGATGDPVAPISSASAFWILAAVIAVVAIASVLMWRSFDELWRQLSVEASALLGNFLLVVCVLWGGAAAAGMVAAPQPLDLLSLAFGGLLLATFVVIGRRGMMTPN